jgi:hypothetical protein
MKDDTKPTLAEVAALLCPGPPPDWVIDRLQRNAPWVGYHTGTDNDDVERLLFQSAMFLRDWLPIYAHAAEMLGEECPTIIDDFTGELEKLIPFLTKDINRPQASRPPDLRLRLCAGVCLGVWREVRGVSQPYSPKLWAACEAYWIHCDYSRLSSSGDLKKWERHLLHHITTPK